MKIAGWTGWTGWTGRGAAWLASRRLGRWQAVPALLLAGALLTPPVAASGPAAGGQAAATQPALVAPQAQEISTEGPSGRLAGTLLRPAGADAPVVLILPGAGPTDRDGNNPLGIKAASYRLLAEGLAARGIASLRIDKRGMFGSRQGFAQPDDVTLADYGQDVHAWIGQLRRITGAECVWLLGHSEGGLVALVAGRQPEHVCGMVLMASAGRPLGQVLREQLKANPANAPLLPFAEQAITALEKGGEVPQQGMPHALLPMFRSSVQRFLRSVFEIDPAREAAAFGKPLLVVQGGKDLQISLKDARRLHEAAAGSALLLLPDSNHVMKDVQGDSRMENLLAYQSAELPLSPGLVEGIAKFIGAAGRKR